MCWSWLAISTVPSIEIIFLTHVYLFFDTCVSFIIFTTSSMPAYSLKLSSYTISFSFISWDIFSITAQQPQKPVASPAATKPKNPRNTPVKTAGAPKMRPQSAPAKAVAKSEPPKAPFVPYGCKDRGYELGHKKTHNVRASADVSVCEVHLQ